MKVTATHNYYRNRIKNNRTDGEEGGVL